MAGIVDCSDFCRLCLVKEQVNNPIFEDDGRNRQVHTKISTCLPVKVTWEDALPKRICDGCNYKLDQQFQFWSTSVNSEKQLKQWLGIVDEEEPKPAVKTKKEKLETSASKRPRRNARRKAVQNIRQAVAAQQQSDSDDGEPLASLVDRDSDFDYNDTITKEETNSENDFPSNNTDSVEPTTFVNVTLDNEIGQAGPSGIQKPSVADTGETEAPEGLPPVLVDHFLSKNNTPLKKKYERKKKTKGVKCPICDETFKNRDERKIHRDKEHNVERPFKCKLCDKNYQKNHHLRKHVSSTHVELKFKCDICFRAFPANSKLKLHYQRHLKQFTCYCEHCSRGFYSRSEMGVHIDSAHSNERKFQCDLCPKTFSTRKYLLSHKRKHARLFKCSFCDIGCPTKDSLERHLRQHTGEAPKHMCHICGKTLTSKDSLRDHLLLHKGEKPFKCDLCDKRFSKKKNVGVHRIIHTGEKPHKCPYCDKSYSQRTPLTLHIRGHTGERPHKCNLCDDDFVSRQLLEAHKTKEHFVLKIDKPLKVLNK